MTTKLAKTIRNVYFQISERIFSIQFEFSKCALGKVKQLFFAAVSNQNNDLY